MTHDNRISNSLIPERRVPAKALPHKDRRDCNCAVPLEAFDRERMGIAAKE